MADRSAIHGKRRALSASSILEAVADDLSQIKKDDKLTFVDLGRILGKSDDQAAKYCDGAAEMGVIAYAFARDQWNGRFTGSLDKLIEKAADHTSDRAKHSTILRAALAISIMLEDDTIHDEEIRENRKPLEEARDALDKMLRRVGPKGATA